MEWSPEFCLVCDRQTDGGIYCGEACRLAEYEKATSTSEAGSPTSPRGFPAAWSSIRTANNAYETSSAHDNAAQASSHPPFTPGSSALATPEHKLTPSSSRSSIVSMQSSSSSTISISIPTEPSHLSNEACRELRAYAGSFDLSRYQRRQSA